MKSKRAFTRRQFLKTAALSTAAIAGAPYVKTSHSAGKLSIGVWDHWVPGANEGALALINDWGKKNNVEVSVDLITSIGSKLELTVTAESRAKAGHDIIDTVTWHTTIVKDSLEPVDDVVNDLARELGPFNPDGEYLGKHDGVWRAMPGPIGSHTYPMVSRLDYFKRYAGVDLKKIFPAGDNRDARLVDEWNYDNFLVYVEKLFKAGHPFGNPIGPTTDSQDWLGPLFRSYGGQPMDAQGNITFDSDGTRMALEYMKKLVPFMPPEIYAWDDASNNRWIISGKGSCIQNPPSAWTVAKRDRPEVAAQMWHHDTPRGPKGRFRGSLPRMWGLWGFSPNKSAAKDLMRWIGQKSQVAKLVTASQGYDVPLNKAHYDNPIWKTIGPPVGGQYNYPIRGDEFVMVTGYPAPQGVAALIYTQALIPNTVARVTQGGESIDEAIKWAVGELEGYLRS
jgi:ABC-type glycerol-3-phosphate transport system substrate-binding protein